MNIELIYLGFDRQQHIVCYNARELICKKCDRTTKIFDGLYAVSKRVRSCCPPYTHTVRYSNQAWSDLLSVSE